MTRRFAAIGGHHNHRAGTVEWLTPPEIIAALGPFDLDPCAPERQPYPTAARTFTRQDNGLRQRWCGRVWLNPPYSDAVIAQWLARMAEHAWGTALIFARTETDAFHRYVWDHASALLFMRGRINFHHLDGTRAKKNAGAPSVLCAYGADDADVLCLAQSAIEGRFVPLRFPRSVLGTVFAASNDDTWASALADFFAGRDDPVELAELYAAFATHPKAARNRNVDAKLRQLLQRGPYRRVSAGIWQKEMAL